MNLTNELIVRFRSRIHYGDPDECWEWGSGTRDLYGEFRINGKLHGAHRVMWTIENGPIPDGLYVCHECDYPPCVNPSHLFLGDNSLNQKDSANKKRHHWAKKTHCPQGHPYSKENTAIRTTSKGGQARHCLECHRIKNRDWQRAVRLTRDTDHSSPIPSQELPSAP